MSSSKPPQQHRSTSSRPSRNTLYVEHVPTNRSRSSPNRQVIIILTNDHEILRHSRHLQPQVNITKTKWAYIHFLHFYFCFRLNRINH